uniref:Histone H1 n=1 Tax=Noccaea caerulescens TaxID=107243 RepID=A0A1J3H8M7_NOCCA
MAKAKIESPKTRAASGEKSKKPRKPKTATHPPYFQMINEALMTLKEKNGSSPYAIAKKIEDKHKSTLPENFRKTLSLQLKNSVAKGKLTKIRASYKLSETTTMRTTRQQQQKKTMTRSSSKKSKNTMPLNKPEVATKKKRKTKKPRQPKSIKSSGSKKVLRASAT